MISKRLQNLAGINEELKDYPKAGENAQPEIKTAIKRWHELKDKPDEPLLYWLLGSGTPPYKMSKKDSEYGEERKGQRCGNCKFAYKKVIKDRIICSQISGEIKPEMWCRLWKGDK